MENNKKLRKKKKYTCPNPLFVKWLTEWKQEAADKGLKCQYTYSRALSSLKKYPLPLSSGKEAKILDHFGDKICSMLDSKLQDYRQNSRHMQSCSPVKEPSTSSIKNTFTTKKTFSQKVASVVPVRMVKNTTIQRKLPSSSDLLKAVEFLPQKDSITSESKSFKLLSGQFRIILCVDNCETVSGHGKSKKQFLSDCQKSGIDFEVRKLHVGDFLWVAQDNYDSSHELILDFVVERKRLDDLAHSIKDGRFREQKFRMKNSGVRSPVYMVENCGSAKYLGIPEATLEQALINTQIIDGFIVKRTQNIKDSANYLSVMTQMLKNKYQHQTLVSGSREFVEKTNASSNVFLTFQEFNTSSIKNKALTVKEMFAKHLLQIFSLSVDRAAAIVDHYETPSLFIEAYDKHLSDSEKLHMISTIKYGVNRKNIGPALSKALLYYYGTRHLYCTNI